MNTRWRISAGLAVACVIAWFGLASGADAQLYFSTDKNGENRVSRVQEGDQIWIVVIDPDEDIDCDVRDKVWTDVKVMDTKTGAHIVWRSYIDAFGVDTTGDGAGDLVFRGDPGYQPHKGHWPGPTAGWLGADYLEETNAATGVFVSTRPFQIGGRANLGDDPRGYTHVVGPFERQPDGAVDPTDFEWGGYLYADFNGDTLGDERVWIDQGGNRILAAGAAAVKPIPDVDTAVGNGDAWLPPGAGGGPPVGDDYMLGRFENMDTLVGLYVDPNDASDVALAQLKILDTRSTVSWGREVYKDPNAAALVTVVDPDENLHCGVVEYVPVFILVNPGSWNPLNPNSATNFCELKRYGGVVNLAGAAPAPLNAIVWYNTYRNFDPATGADIFINLAADGSDQPNAPGTYYLEYPRAGDNNVTAFDTASGTGITRVMFYAQETGPDTGVFEFRINSILEDLGFNSLNVRDVLVAYYIDPNDQDDFSLSTAYIEESNHSRLRFTDSARRDESIYWIGRDPVYVEVKDANANTDRCCPEKVVVHVCDPHEVDDAEWLVLDELDSNSSVFFSHHGMKLSSVWDAMGIGDPGAVGGYSLRLDNWDLEAFNEDTIYARYNDVKYFAVESAPGANDGMDFLGDRDETTAFPPAIEAVRVANDVSFALLHVGDTQVYDGQETRMRFLDRGGRPVTGYVSGDCVFVEVIDPDQDEDRNRRERVSRAWDGWQNVPFGPQHRPWNRMECGYRNADLHAVNPLLGDTNIFASFDPGAFAGMRADPNASWAKIYILNPRNGRWAAVDLLETGTDTGTFVSLACVDLADVNGCVPTLDVFPGDTILAVYHDPSNHSDIAWISIKVALGGIPTTKSSLCFVDATGEPVAGYLAGDPIFVQVVDPSLIGAGTLVGALTVDGMVYDLNPIAGTDVPTFTAGPIALDAVAGETITATYVDPTDPSDISTASVPIVASVFRVERFFAGPSPFADETQFGFVGSGMAETFRVTVSDLTGRRVWQAEAENVLFVPWDGRNAKGQALANGAYLYTVAATGSGKTFTAKGKVFIHR